MIRWMRSCNSLPPPSSPISSSRSRSPVHVELRRLFVYPFSFYLLTDIVGGKSGTVIHYEDLVRCILAIFTILNSIFRFPTKFYLIDDDWISYRVIGKEIL